MKPSTGRTAEDAPPDDVPPTPPKKPPDVEMEDIEEFPDDEVRPTNSKDANDDAETVLKPAVDDPLPEEPIPPDDENCRNLKFNKEGENMYKFDKLCDKYKSIFSKMEGDLGKTNLLYHSIELTHQNPVYTPNYKALHRTFRKQLTVRQRSILPMALFVSRRVHTAPPSCLYARSMVVGDTVPTQ